MATNKPPGKALKIEIILNSFTSFLIHKETFDIGSFLLNFE